jgi:hypothetical protein
MGYTFTCDHCGTGVNRTPPFMGEFRESFLKTSDSPLTEAFQPGQTVTVCRECSEGLFL